MRWRRRQRKQRWRWWLMHAQYAMKIKICCGWNLRVRDKNFHVFLVSMENLIVYFVLSYLYCKWNTVLFMLSQYLTQQFRKLKPNRRKNNGKWAKGSKERLNESNFYRCHSHHQLTTTKKCTPQELFASLRIAMLHKMTFQNFNFSLLIGKLFAQSGLLVLQMQ